LKEKIKVGIIAILNPGGVGDMLLSTSVLKYRNELWPGKDIVWYCVDQNNKVLSSVPGLKELRPVVYKDRWLGWTTPHDCDLFLATAPWMTNLPERILQTNFPIDTLMTDKHKRIVEKATSTRILGGWHPCLECSDVDRNVAETIRGLLPYDKTVMMETGYYSGQSFLTMEILERLISEIRRAWGDCNFVFVSGGEKSLIPEGRGMFSCSKLSLSSVVSLFNLSDAFVGVSSGLSIAVCSWDANPDVPRIELIQDPTAATRKVSRGPISTVFDEEQLFTKLPEFLSGKYDYIPTEYTGPSVLFEKKVYSQNGEDGIIESLFKHIGTTNKFFVEIGAGNGTENNTRKLAEEGWHGIWISLDEFVVPLENVKSMHIKVTAENVNKLLEGVPPEIDLLSVDIDGNDYYIWDAIECVSPRVVVVEYNPFFPPPISKTIEYDPNFRWICTPYFGATLTAWSKLAAKKGYSLVCCDNSGTNAFFAKGLQNITPEEAYVPFRGYTDELVMGNDTRKWVEI
jgi:hypothetical protein